MAAAVLALSSGSVAYAATQLPTTGQGNGLKIAPVRTDLTIDKGASRQVTLAVENITAFPMTVQAVANDFMASDDESGEPRILLDAKDSAPDNSFKKLITNLPTVAIKPSERREVKMTITVPKDATSGGYYGAIRFVPGNGNSNKNVSLTASVGSLFLITVPGNVTQQLKVQSFDVIHNGDVGSLFNSGPIAIQTRFKNIGNVHVSPFGKLYVKSFSGKVINEVEINDTQPRGSILPGSVRKFVVTSDGKKDSNNKEIPLLHDAKFGRYTVEGSFGYGDNGDLLLAKKTFYIIPYKYIAGVLLAIAFFIFVLPRLIRAYNQSIVRRAQAANGPPAKSKPVRKPRPRPKK